MSEAGESILCIRLSGLGDVVHALNTLALLREERPGARITWIVEDRFAGVLDGHPQIDELITIPRGKWGRWLWNPLAWPRLGAGARALARRLRRARFDVSIDFQSSIKSAWLVAGARARKRIGFARPVSREFNRLAQTDLVDPPAAACHRIERDVALLGPLGIAPRNVQPQLPFDKQRDAAAGEICRGLARPLVVMHPGTSRYAAFKRWPAENYAALADRLVDERGVGVLVTWGPGEKELAQEVVDRAQRTCTLAPKLPGLLELVHVLRRADLFVASDTGPMHIASALGRPVVALFGPKDPDQTGPYGDPSEVVTAAVDCRPCTKRRCSDRRCMTRITADAVFDAASRLL